MTKQEMVFKMLLARIRSGKTAEIHTVAYYGRLADRLLEEDYRFPPEEPFHTPIAPIDLIRGP